MQRGGNILAHYLVTATPQFERLEDLRSRLAAGEFVSLEPFGEEVSDSLRNARRREDGTAVWEEEDYCRPPLAQERQAVLDQYFTDIAVEAVNEGEGWRRIEQLPHLFPDLAGG